MAFSPLQNLPSRRRVVVTGAGIVTSMGCGWEANAEGFRTGRRALREVTLFDTSPQRSHIAGEATLPAGMVDATRCSPRRLARLGRASRLLIGAGQEALAAAGWRIPESGLADIPTVLGTSAAAMEFGEAFYRHAISPDHGGRGQATSVLSYQPQAQALDLAAATGIHGPATIVSNACASGANAIGHAFHLVASGRADRAMAGGYDALCQLVFAGFDSLQALSTTTPRPFARDRDGLAIGEGAALVTLETLEAAETRGAHVLAEVVGYGAATDSHHLTQPHPEGSAAVRTMGAACREAGIAPAEIDYINSHGTGTPLNDSAEGAAIVAWGGADAGRIAVSSTKGGIGHLLGGAGAVESVICLMALEGGWIPPNVPVADPDPVAAGFDLVTAPRPAGLRYALTNSFGFGGSNATLIFRHPTR